MRVFNCIVCGEEAIDKSRTQTKKFCCESCAQAYFRKTHGAAEDTRQRCMYNDGVVCLIPKCKTCGWNPAVAKKRMEAALNG